MKKLPKKSRRWGRARKGLNIFLRDCPYTVHIRKAYRLDQAEQFVEDGSCADAESECEVSGRGSACGEGRGLRQSAP